MLAVIGLLFSFGVILNQRRTFQTAADAASLSGTWQLLQELASDDRSDANVLTAIVAYVNANGVPSDGTAGDATYLTAVYVDATGSALSPSTRVGSGGQFPTAARGVQVSVTSQVPTILPSFLDVWQVLLQDAAAAALRPTTPISAASAVAPIGLLIGDARIAYTTHSLYDLLAHPLASGTTPSLDLAASGAPTFGSPTANMQAWSDGQRTASWQLSQPSSVTLAAATYGDAIASGLHDNVRRQRLIDASGAAYALICVPVFDTVSATSVHVVGFAMLKIRDADITSTSIRALVVPYPVAAWTTTTTPAVDIGSAVVSLVS
ncbi:MAG: hypothetical protein NVSMB2_11400 [Chloroflexota bacterium]